MAESNTFEFLQKLEGFFCSPSFTSSVGDFLCEHSCELEYKAMEEDQPLKNHDIFQRYTKLVEQQLEKFMAEEGLSSEAVFEACQKAQTSGDASWLTCIDYLVASTEYENFMQLAYDHYDMMTNQMSDGEDFEELEEGGATAADDASGEAKAAES